MTTRRDVPPIEFIWVPCPTAFLGRRMTAREREVLARELSRVAARELATWARIDERKRVAS